MTPELRAAVERGYEVFGHYAAVMERAKSLCVCRCPSCMPEECERALVTTPLREVPATLLAEYTNSAHGWDDSAIAAEFRYFLPRYLELIAAYDPPQYDGLPACLERMGDAAWLSKWPAEEVEAVNGFFDAFLRNSLLDLSHASPGRSRYDAVDLDAVLRMIIFAGGDLEHVLRVWDSAPDPGAAVNMAQLRHNIILRNGRFTVYDWPDDRSNPTIGERIADFLRRPDVNARLEAAFFMIDDPDWQRIMSDAMFLGD